MSQQIKSAGDKQNIYLSTGTIILGAIIILATANHRPASMFFFLVAAIACIWFSLKLYYRTERIGIAIGGWIVTLVLVALAVWPAYDLKW